MQKSAQFSSCSNRDLGERERARDSEESENKLRMERLFMFLRGRLRQLHYGNKCINTTRKSLTVLSFRQKKALKLKDNFRFRFFSSRKEETTANIFKVKVKDSKQFLFYLLFIFFNLRSTLVFNLLIYYFLLQSVSSEYFFRSL